MVLVVNKEIMTKITSLVLVSVFALSPVFVFAQDGDVSDANTVATSSRGKSDVQRADRLEMKQEKEAERASTTAERRADHLARIKAFAEQMFERMHAMIARFRNIIERVQSRIDKFEERGIDVIAAQAALDTAEAAVDEAEEAVTDAEAALDAALASDTPREAFAAVRTLVAEVRDALQRARQALSDAIAALKASAPEDTDESEAGE